MQYEQFYNKLRWKIYNKELTRIDNFSYSCFKFKCNIENQSLMEQFIDFISDKANHMSEDIDFPTPWGMVNFLLINKIKFKLRFQYCKELPFKNNIILLKTVMWLNRKLLERWIKNIPYKAKRLYLTVLLNLIRLYRKIMKLGS